MKINIVLVELACFLNIRKSAQNVFLISSIDSDSKNKFFVQSEKWSGALRIPPSPFLGLELLKE